MPTPLPPNQRYMYPLIKDMSDPDLPKELEDFISSYQEILVVYTADLL